MGMSSRMIVSLLMVALIFAITGHYTVAYANANAQKMQRVSLRTL